MTLTELKDFVQQRRIVSLKELSLHFKTDESAIDGAMERLIKKGLVQKIEFTEGQCGGCEVCASGIRRHYEWNGLQSIKIHKS